MMRFLLFLLAIIWGLGILDQKIQSGINKGLGEVSTFTWHQADASSMLTGEKAAQNLSSNFFGEEDGNEEDGEDDEDDRWSVPEPSHEYEFKFYRFEFRKSISHFVRVPDAHLSSPFNPPDVC
jgi:hypothetical protein